MTVEAVKPAPRPPGLLIGFMFHTTRRYSGPAPFAFSPDGSTLAFVSPKDGPAVVCEIPVAGGAPRMAFSIEGAAAHGLSWSPTGDLYITAHRGGTERWQVYVRRRDGKLEDFAVSEGDRVQHHLSQFGASPDGKSVAISTNAREPDDVDVAIVDAQTGRQRLVASGPAWHVAGGWSPDGRWLGVMRVAQNTDQDLMVVEAETGEVAELTAHEGEMQNVPAGWLADGLMLAITDRDSDFLHLEAIDIHSGEREVYERTDWDVELATTSSNGSGVVWSLNEDGYSRLRWRLDNRSVGEREISGTVGDIVVSNDGARCAYTLLPVGGPVEIRILELAGGQDRLLLRGEALPRYPPRPESIRIQGTEGEIPCYVFRPDAHTAQGPALLIIHGGPEGQSRPHYQTALVARMLDQGVAIVMPNIHGSTGYGKAWQTRIHRDWGGIDLADLRSVAEWMHAQPDFDPQRLGVLGGSYGGFASLTCVTRLPEYWCCGVDIFGPCNLVTVLENDPPNWKRWNKLWIGDLDTDRAKLLERSPISYIENVRCPLLVIQEYLTFEGEGHGFARRENQILMFQRMTAFLERHLLA